MLQPVWCPAIHSHSPGYVGAGLSVQHQPQLPGDEKSNGQRCLPPSSCLGMVMPLEMSQGWGQGYVLLGCMWKQVPPTSTLSPQLQSGESCFQEEEGALPRTLPIPGTATGRRGTPRGLT